METLLLETVVTPTLFQKRLFEDAVQIFTAQLWNKVDKPFSLHDNEKMVAFFSFNKANLRKIISRNVEQATNNV